MEIKRQFVPGDGFHVPSVLVTPPDPAGAVVIVHGYGGNKEEQSGLAWRVAETGLAACAIDLRGHGEHLLPFDINALDELEKLPVWQPVNGRPTAIIHGSRDMPEIRQGCIDLKARGIRVTEIEQALHNDIFLLEPTFGAIKSELAELY
jgi:dienelactone hydrolase